MNKIAHKDGFYSEFQSIKEHSECTAKIAGEFAVSELYDIIYPMALLHDIGKYQNSFQEKIIHDKNIRVDHAVCGALEAKKLFGNASSSLLMQYCIAGHHSGIPNGGTLQDTAAESSLHGRMKKAAMLEDYAEYRSEIFPEKPNEEKFRQYLLRGAYDTESLIEIFAFITRYCFSCLTDADSLDTAYFCKGRKNIPLKADFEQCRQKLDERFKTFSAETSLQKARNFLQNQVYEKVNDTAEIYLMNMPTGSGKTLCSMKFALTRAILTGKKRIIYVIPYNSIIDQTAAVLEDIFKDSADILRHQSSFSIDDVDKDEDYRQLIKNVTENWNAQIIVTTSVQFFESLYANKRGKLRKIHNLSDSMIIFDEAHIMPTAYWQPCLRVAAYITRFLHSEAIFLTATMPDFDTLIKKYALPNSKITPLITDTTPFTYFRKGKFVNIGEISSERLLENAQKQPSALIIVNKRSTASELYGIATNQKKYHLSTYMTAFDRKRVIDEIRKELQMLYHDYPDLSAVPENRRIIVISTSLIEAGVDFDFFAVYRELSGLDNILQAGGRCNREGKRENAQIYIFNRKKDIDTANSNITKALLEKYEDIADTECIKEYYDRLFAFHEEIIRRNTIAENVSRFDTVGFADYARNFHMIEDNTVSVAVECDEESKALLEQLYQTEFTDYRKLQKYTFTVYEYELEKLIAQGVVRKYGGVWCLTNYDYYSNDIGITFEAKDYFIL